jgi:23S rRNA pseudouridine1911/1915/1917 synthase
VVWEDADLIVIDKPAGMVVHPRPDPRGHAGQRASAPLRRGSVGRRREKRPGIVHRIDKDTSGLLVVAKTDAAHHGLARAVRGARGERHVSGVCHGVPDPGDPRLRGVKG